MSNDLVHALPTHVFGLTAAAQRAMPQTAHLESEGLHTRPIAGHGKVAAVPTHHRAHVLSLCGNRLVHPPSQLRLHLQQLGAQALAAGDPQHHEFALPGLAAAMREAQEVEGVRFALSPAASVFPGEAPELDQPRLLGMQLQPELAQPLGRRTLKALGVTLKLEPGNPIVGIPHHDHVASGMAPPPLFHPQVERVVQVDVGQQRTDHAIDAKGNFEFERRIALCRTLSILDFRRKK